MERQALRSALLWMTLVVPLLGSTVTLESGSSLTRRTGPASLSGITYAGNGVYYAVADNGEECGLYKITIGISADGKSLGGLSVGSRVGLAMANDIEGVAFDPGSGNVWVADEGAQSITEYDPQTGAALRRVSVPAVLSSANIVGNYGFESLTISGDGLTMWTANEEALTCDGNRSSYAECTVVRLIKFVRKTINDDWKSDAMFAYWVDKWHNPYAYEGRGRRGVSDLCAMPDGSLLVLERELSDSESDASFWVDLGVDLFYSIYRVTPDAMADALADVRDKDGGLADVTGWRGVKKELLYASPAKWINCEGICLGPRISSEAVELIAVSDAGDGITSAVLIPHVLSGLNVWTQSFGKPKTGCASTVGTNFRYLDGAVVSVRLDGVNDSAYCADGSTRWTVGWSMGAQDLPVVTGSGRKAEFTVRADGTFWWNMDAMTAMTCYAVADSFESVDVGSSVAEVGGWRGEYGSVVACTYNPATPPGFAMAREPHERVLDVRDGGEAARKISGSFDGSGAVDVMVMIQRPSMDLTAPNGDAQMRIAVDRFGRVCMWNGSASGTDTLGCLSWIPLSDRVYNDGQWIRLGLEFDYESNPDGRAFVRVKIDGSYQATVNGVRSPTDPKPYGAWYCLRGTGGGGPAAGPEEIVFSNTRVDDLLLYKVGAQPDHTGEISVEGVPFKWFDQAGLPRNPLAAAPFIPGYTLGDVYTAGLDPYSDRPLELVDFRMGEHGEVHAEFNGYKGEEPVGYQMLYSTTPDFKSPIVLHPTDGKFDGDSATWTTTWDGKIPDDAMNGGFYRLRAVR